MIHERRSCGAGEEAGPPNAGSVRESLGSTMPLQGLRILVVEDDADSRLLLGLILETFGSTVTVAATVDGAMRAIDCDIPDLLLSDICMAGQDGFDLIRRVRALPSDKGARIPAVALTGYSGMAERGEVLRAGYTGHLIKPIAPTQLVTALSTVAKRPHAMGDGC